MSNNIKILKNYLIYFLLMILVCIVGISNVFGATISDYATKYYYYSANDNSSTSSTVYRSGNDNFVTLFGAEAPTYDNGEGFNGFYNRINYSIVKGNIYTLNLILSYSNLQDSEFLRSDVYNRLFNTNFAHCSNCSISSVSGFMRRYNASAPVGNNLYDFTVSISYTFVATSTTNQWYIGTYTGDDRVLGVDNHLYTSIVSVTGLTIEENNSSTIINQNDTIINQNNQIIEQNNQNTQDIINNQNSNNQSVINNNNTNTNNIMNNNNQNTDKIIEDNKKNFQSCRDSVNLFSSQLEQGSISATSGITIGSPNRIRTSSFISINSNTNYTLSIKESGYLVYVFEYDSSYNFIDRIPTNWIGLPYTFTTKSNAKHIKVIFSLSNSSDLVPTDISDIQLQKGSLKTDYEPYGEEICVNKLDEQKNAITGLNDTLNNDDSSGATSEASDFFNSFTTNTFGLTSIITAPLNLIQSLTRSTCSDLHLPLPYLNNKYLDLPCMTTIYQTHFGLFFTMYQTITYGIIAYWVCVRIFNQVKDFKNPEHDEIEVVDL